jgi:hypothetical protein
MAAYIAVAATSQIGADFTMIATDAVSLLLTDGTANPRLPREASARIQVKNAGLKYIDIGVLNADNPMQVISGAGVYRVITAALAGGLGCDKT